MSLPDSSYLVNVGQLRYIQSLCEPAHSRNPDAVVGAFLSLPQRLACIVRGTLLRPRLRANPFYHYVLARTRYYDALFLQAVNDSVACNRPTTPGSTPSTPTSEQFGAASAGGGSGNRQR